MTALALLIIVWISRLAVSYTIQKVTINEVEYSKFVPESTEPNTFRDSLFISVLKPYKFLQLSSSATDMIWAQPVRVFGKTFEMKLTTVTKVEQTNRLGIYTAQNTAELLKWLKQNTQPKPILDPYAFTFDIKPYPPKLPPAQPGHCYMNAAITVAENVVGFKKWNGKKWNKEVWEAMAKQLSEVTKKTYYTDGWSREFVQLMLRTQGLNFGLNPHPRPLAYETDDTNELKYEFQRDNFRPKEGSIPPYDFRSVAYFEKLLKGEVQFETMHKDPETEANVVAMILAVSTNPLYTKADATADNLRWPRADHATVVLHHPLPIGHWWYIDTNQQYILPLKPNDEPDVKYVTNKDADKFSVNFRNWIRERDGKYKVEQSAQLGGNVHVVAQWLHNKCNVQTIHGGGCGALFYYVIVLDHKSKIDNWDEYVKSRAQKQQPNSPWNEPNSPRNQPYSPWDIAEPIIILFGTIEVLIFCTCCFVGAVVGYLIHFVKEKYVFSK